MKILTLNVWQERGPWQSRWEIILEGVRQIKPDILAFQELFNESWALQVSKAAGYSSMVFPEYHSGLVLYSNSPIFRHGEGTLTSSPLEEYGRYFLWAEFEAAGEKLLFFNTHLSWKLEDGASRKKQAGELLKVIRDTAKETQAVLAGDLNAPPHSEEVRWLIQEGDFTDVFHFLNPNENGFTWDNRNPYAAGASHDLPDRRIDQILTRGRGKLLANPSSCRLVYTQPRQDGVWASDHFGVLAEFK